MQAKNKIHIAHTASNFTTLLFFIVIYILKSPVFCKIRQ